MLAAAGVVAILLGCASTPPPAQPGLHVALPSPLEGPGAPKLEKRPARQLERAWLELLAGRTSEAALLVAQAEESRATRLLGIQVRLADDGSGLVPELRELVDLHPGYAAAWITLSVAAEHQADELGALLAARSGADLWSRSSWSDRAERLYQGWVVGRITQATQKVTRAAFAEALELIELALGLEPTNRDGLMIKARALIGLGQPSEAEKVLAALGADPEAIFLAATISEMRDDWLTAMDLYSGLPVGYPGRDRRLAESQLNWRLSHQPPHVKQALRSPELTRSQLAVLLAVLEPQLEGMHGNPAPVLSDIVEAPGRREILTAVRVGLLDIDSLEHRFRPNQVVKAAEARGALERLAQALDRDPPRWCNNREDEQQEESENTSDCDMITAPVSGAEVATVILENSREERP